jgi:hypothetical protein
VGEREAAKPTVTCGIDAEACRGCRGRGGDGGVGEDHSTRLTGRPTGGHHDGVTVLNRATAVQTGDRAIGADQPGGGERLEEGARRGSREARVERGDRVAGVPHRPQGVDEPAPTWQVQRHELGHRPVA